MLKIWDATNFRRTVGGLCLILAPLLHFAGERLAPSNTGTASDWLAAASQDSGRYVESIILILVSGILMIPALFAIAHVVRGRGVILAHIGVGVTLVAVVLDTFVSAGANLMVAVMGSAGLDSGAMTGLIQKSLTAPSVVSTTTFIGFFLQLPGYFLIGLAVWRSGFGYRWAGPLVSLWVVAAFFNPVQSDIRDRRTGRGCTGRDWVSRARVEGHGLGIGIHAVWPALRHFGSERTAGSGRLTETGRARSCWAQSLGSQRAPLGESQSVVSQSLGSFM